MRLVSGDCLYRGWLHSHWLVVILATVQYTRHSVHQHRLNKIHYTVKWVTTLVPVLQHPPSLSSNSLSLFLRPGPFFNCFFSIFSSAIFVLSLLLSSRVQPSLSFLHSSPIYLSPFPSAPSPVIFAISVPFDVPGEGVC